MGPNPTHWPPLQAPSSLWSLASLGVLALETAAALSPPGPSPHQAQPTLGSLGAMSSGQTTSENSPHFVAQEDSVWGDSPEATSAPSTDSSRTISSHSVDTFTEGLLGSRHYSGCWKFSREQVDQTLCLCGLMSPGPHCTLLGAGGASFTFLEVSPHQHPANTGITSFVVSPQSL